MHTRHPAYVVLTLICTSLLSFEIVLAQTPARRGAPAGAAAAPARGQQVDGTLLQVMRAILFPNSNVIFAGQLQDPGAVKKDPDPTSSVNPLASIYGGWEAVENSGLALAEAANLLTIPGRVCSNGKPAPIQNADWQRFVGELRAAGMAAYKAGKSKSMDAVVEVSDTVSTACMHCHDVYREKTPAQGGLASRCTK